MTTAFGSVQATARVRLAPHLADLGVVLASLRSCQGTEVVSTALLLRDVEGLNRRARSVRDWGTGPRARHTRSA
jgi:hypothetical protein